MTDYNYLVQKPWEVSETLNPVGPASHLNRVSYLEVLKPAVIMTDCFFFSHRHKPRMIIRQISQDPGN